MATSLGRRRSRDIFRTPGHPGALIPRLPPRRYFLSVLPHPTPARSRGNQDLSRQRTKVMGERSQEPSPLWGPQLLTKLQSRQPPGPRLAWPCCRLWQLRRPQGRSPGQRGSNRPSLWPQPPTGTLACQLGAQFLPGAGIWCLLTPVAGAGITGLCVPPHLDLRNLTFILAFFVPCSFCLGR